MIICKRTDSDNQDFQALVRELDHLLRILDGEDHEFYAQFNKTDKLRQAIVAYDGEMPVGCGAIREYEPGVMEVKRMFVAADHRNKGIGGIILAALEDWARDLKVRKCVLETGRRQPDAIRLYEKSGYRLIANYGQYAAMENSVCFEKML